MKRFIYFILISICINLPLQSTAKHKDCCKGHNGSSNCYQGFLLCGDGSTSNCECVNHILTPPITNSITNKFYDNYGPPGRYAKKHMITLEKPRILKFEWVGTAKNKVTGMFKKPSLEEEIIPVGY